MAGRITPDGFYRTDGATTGRITPYGAYWNPEIAAAPGGTKFIPEATFQNAMTNLGTGLGSGDD